ncbi:unnamed protein product, partial [Meganyctiphanes norvegica]
MFSGPVAKPQPEAWQPGEKRETIKSRVSSRDRTNTSSPLNDQILCGGLDSNCNGWDVNEMFRKNKEKFGVTSSYSPDLEGYTTPLIKRNTKEYREKEAEATRIAAEILRSPVSKIRAEAENRDEEDLNSFGKFPEKEMKRNGAPSYHSQYDNNFSPGKTTLEFENKKIKSPPRSKMNTKDIEDVTNDSKDNNQYSKKETVISSDKSQNTKKNGISKHIIEEINRLSENNNNVALASEQNLSQDIASNNKSQIKTVIVCDSSVKNSFKEKTRKDVHKLDKEETLELIYTNGAARQEIDETLSSISSDDSFLTENTETQLGFESPVRPKEKCFEEEEIAQLKMLAQDELDGQIGQCIEFMSRIQKKTVEVETEESWHESLARQLSQDREQLQVVVRQALVNKRSMEAAKRDIRLAETRMETENSCEDASGLVEAMNKWERDQYVKMSEILAEGSSVLVNSVGC